ncbi:DNA helicase [Paenibacillus sp. J31TS4]|uniref:RNA polymerase recycling motor HelD n=1 Tax=Paenibacillus sp. J31TS4 TaxID=2807195 RepID=UPI001B2D5C33|nr:RNA polymerase recycling motor HelD [Paenibacillus sp. J31TS4]GIP38919.1 DNA helicase [Paenibacillus sp. J31TS4]
MKTDREDKMPANSSAEWEQEQQRVEAVTAKLKREIERLEPELGELKDQVVDIRKHFWDEVTVNLSSGDDVIETAVSLRQQAEVLSERERSHRHRQALLRRLHRLLPSPYFGRIDFHEKDFGTERIYIGLASFLDEDGETFLVYDWRTPVASLYYDFPPGPASYETPGGTIEGELELKRQFTIRDGRLLSMFDTGITIGDDLLQQVLSRGANSQMKSIVATIQREQNQLIRNDKSRMLIVQGAAGSGKTSAALQRVAYLLYKYRDSLRADQMVLFSPNPLFNSYVRSVLPELGEENMQQTTFQEYLDAWLGDTFRVEDPFDQMEALLTQEREDTPRMAGIRFKASETYLEALLAYRDSLLRDGMQFRDVVFRNEVLLAASRIREQFYGYDASIRLPNRLELLKEWLLGELAALEKAERAKDWVRDEIDYLDNEQYDRIYRQMKKRQRGKEPSFDDAAREEELLRRTIVQEQFRPLRQSVKKLEFVDQPLLYRQLFADSDRLRGLAGAPLPEEWEAICRETVASLDEGVLLYEDATPYLFLRELVEGFRVNMDIRHVLVDEAQDYSAFQFAFLKRLFPRARMTVLGDFQQAIFAHSTPLQGETPVAKLYGEAETERILLTRSYRSTREIVEFTRGMLPGGEEIVPFDRSGGKPVVVRGASREQLAKRMAADLEALGAEGFASVAVLCKTEAESREACRTLEALGAEVRLLTKESPSFEKGTVVVPAYLAKGVEFDAVLLYDASAAAWHRESERKLFYTACTRAMHRLALYCAGELSPFVAALDASTYVSETADR